MSGSEAATDAKVSKGQSDDTFLDRAKGGGLSTMVVDGSTISIEVGTILSMSVSVLVPSLVRLTILGDLKTTAVVVVVVTSAAAPPVFTNWRLLPPMLLPWLPPSIVSWLLPLRCRRLRRLGNSSWISSGNAYE